MSADVAMQILYKEGTVPGCHAVRFTVVGMLTEISEFNDDVSHQRFSRQLLMFHLSSSSTTSCGGLSLRATLK